jgi:hypothetical protein
VRTAACLIALIAGVTPPVSAQTFVNLDFEQAKLESIPPPSVLLPWEEAVPGWGHSDGDSTEFVYYLTEHLGFSQVYTLLDTANSPFGAASGSWAVQMRSGTLREHEPRGPFIAAFLSQTGRVPTGAQELSILSSSFMFSVTLDGTSIPLRPVGVDPSSPTYLEDLQSYSGEWIGDVSAFAGHVVELKVQNTNPDGQARLAVDEVTFLPVPEPSTTALMALGLVTLLVPRVRGKRRS